MLMQVTQWHRSNEHVVRIVNEVGMGTWAGRVIDLTAHGGSGNDELHGGAGGDLHLKVIVATT